MIKKPAYTPGPWKLVGTTVRDERGHRLATVGVGGLIAPEEVQANVWLMLAAPELLAALQGLLAVLNDDLDPDQCAAWDAALAALSKAEGVTAPSPPDTARGPAGSARRS